MRTLIFALVLSAGLGAAQSQEASPSIAGVVRQLEMGQNPVRVVCFGDSITGVYYHTGSRRAWTDLLGLAILKAWPSAKVEMVNAGISGNTTAQGLARMEREVIAKRPDLVAVMFGMNDVARTPVETYEANLRQISARCCRAGAAVIFCTPNSVTETPDRPNAKLAEFSEAMRRVAAGEGWPVADAFADWESLRKRDFGAWTLLMSETIHPNLNGHRRFAELMASTLSGKAIELADSEVGFDPDPIPLTRSRLEAGEPVKIVAMPPYDQWFPELARNHFPNARLEVLTWPVTPASAASKGGDPWSSGGREAAKG
ncbi:MAG: hypothetical protein KDL87_13520, partial [Verrucomicrobiae bacterium]|nr:hypothetical protein [Verrucomicrobiae bacterium]